MECRNCARKSSSAVLTLSGYDYSSYIASADDSYFSRKSWDDSVPRLDWSVNEACMNLLTIIAYELDVTGAYSSYIASADDSYVSRKSWDDSVPRLNWYVNEANMTLLTIIALELN